MKTIWRSQQAFVPIKTNYIARAVKECGAMTALSKMPIERSPLDRIKIPIDVI